MGCLLRFRVNKNRGGFFCFYKDLNHIEYFTVSHHGSTYNWHSDILNNNSAKTYIVSRGINYKHRHPDINVVWDIREDKKGCVWVKEEITLELEHILKK